MDVVVARQVNGCKQNVHELENKKMAFIMFFLDDPVLGDSTECRDDDPRSGLTFD